MKILFASTGEKPEVWLPLLKEALPRDELAVVPSKDVDVALVALPPAGTFEKIGRPRLIQSLWMGVEKLLADPTLPRGVPLARTIDPGMVAAMSEMVLACVLDWHRNLYRYRMHQRAGSWQRIGQRMAGDRTIGLLGLGELGSDAARKLVALGFNVAGWSRRPKNIPGAECFTDLAEMLPKSDVVVCLLPLTRDTQGLLDGKTFAAMKRGGCVINLARGGHLVLKDLLDALDSGALSHAYLDVFEREPLPASDPLWRHPGVTLTPHIAALTEPRTALPRVVANIERVRRGEAPRDLVDFEAGY
ncbi:MAG: glyoxylate/hydroxypyruvate reductase A [Betaproteobacteria bacterium]|nr:MAG: glyoxylate/hydroxypyruvate reductase A [Betaproteobacteria bacterium]